MRHRSPGHYFELAVPPHRTKMVASLWYVGRLPDGIDDYACWGEIHQEPGHLVLEIYPSPSGDPWSFDLEEVEGIIKTAKACLQEPSH